MADLMQKQYVEVFSKPSTDDGNQSNTDPHIDNIPTLEDIEFIEADIIKAIEFMPSH